VKSRMVTWSVFATLNLKAMSTFPVVSSAPVFEVCACRLVEFATVLNMSIVCALVAALLQTMKVLVPFPVLVLDTPEGLVAPNAHE